MRLPRKLTALILTTTLLLAACQGPSPSPQYCTTQWHGEVDEDLLAKVIVDLQRAQDNGCSKLTAEIFSPGGAVVVGLEIVRRMREAERAGLVIETRGGALVASMATVILAAGTPGHRFTSHYTLTVIHAIRGGFMGECLSLVPDPQTEGTKIANELITTLAVALAELTGNPSSVTLGWLECGKEQVGSGGLLVDLGFADHLIEG